MLEAPFIVALSVVFAQVFVLMLEPRYLLDWLGQYIEMLHPRLQKLLTCSTCIAGQLSLWSYPIVCEYNVLVHLTTVVLTIWVAHIMDRIFFD